MHHIIGVDLGTTHIKAAAVSEKGQVLGSVERRNETFSPNPGWQEQEPEAIFQHVKDAVSEVQKPLPRGSELKGIVFSSAMHSLICVDNQGVVLTNAMLWSDLRAAETCKKFRADCPLAKSVSTETGVPHHPMSPFFKIKWLSENAPELLARAHKLLGIKEFVWHRIFGEFEMDISLASATGLFDCFQMAWHEVALSKSGCRLEQLPVLVSPYFHRILDEAQAKMLNLPPGTPIIIGASDGALANIGSAAVGKERLAVSIGTSAAVRVCLPEIGRSPVPETFCYRLDEQFFILGGGSNNGGNILQWLENQEFAKGMSAPEIFEEAQKAPAGADGLIFRPYVFGERAPVWDADAKPGFFNVKPAHERRHFLRAVLEGIFFNLRLIFENIPDWRSVKQVHASGGFFKNEFALRMLAGVFGLAVFVPAEKNLDASVRGAVMLARKALKMKPLPRVLAERIVLPNSFDTLFYGIEFSNWRNTVRTI